VKLTKEVMAGLYKEQTSRSRRGKAECLSADLLARASTGDVDEGERELVAGHLASCSDCIEEYRMIAPLEDWANLASDAARDHSRSTASIVDLPAKSIESVQPANDRNNVIRPAWIQHPVAVRVMPYAMAAVFLILCVFLGFWAVSLKRANERLNLQAENQRTQRETDLAAANQDLEETRRRLDESLRQSQPSGGENKKTEVAELQQKVDELSRPQYNIPITDLEPHGSVRGEANPGKTIEVGPGVNYFTVILNVSGQPSFKDYLLEIQDRGGKTIWNGRGLRKSQYNTFTVMLTRRLLPAGSYHLKLYGASGSQRELIENYPVRIEYK